MSLVTELPTSTIHEAAGKIGALPSAIRPVGDGMRLAGPAVTVRCHPGDNLWLHRAIARAAPGSVLVADVGGAYEFGYWGEIMHQGALARGLGGLVIDGCVRDGARLRELGFPVFSRGLCMQGTTKDLAGPGGVDLPIRIGAVDISPGDLVVGDLDGVVVVPSADVQATLERAAAREDHERTVIARLQAGETTLQVYGWP